MVSKCRLRPLMSQVHCLVCVEGGGLGTLNEKSQSIVNSHSSKCSKREVHATLSTYYGVWLN